MKKLLLAVIAAAVTFAFIAPSFAERVRGHQKKDGTWVESYNRSRRDGVKLNNYSSYGNINPHTGKKGSKKW